MNDWSEAEQHVERAHELYQAGRWVEAENELRAALSLNPYQAEWHFNLGLTLEASERFDEAVAAFKESFELGRRDASAALMVGVNFLRSGDAPSAIRWLKTAEKLDPDNADTFIHRIEAYARLGQHDQAEVMFYLAQQLEPDAPDAYANLAESLLERNLHEKAVWCLKEAARLAPDMPMVHARLADAYAATGRLERARQLYLVELRHNPGDVETILDLGALLVEMNRFPEAGEKFRRALEIEPDNTEAHFRLGELAQKQSENDEAMGHFDVVSRLDPEYPAVRRRLAGLLIGRGLEEDLIHADELLTRELARHRQHPDAFALEDLVDLGDLLLDAAAAPAAPKDLATSMAREAVRICELVVAAGPEDAEAHHHLSVAHFRAGDLTAGVEQAREALQLEPRCVPALHNLALACVRQRRWKRSRYWVDQALRLDPDDAALRRLQLFLRLHTLAEPLGWIGKLFRRGRKPA